MTLGNTIAQYRKNRNLTQDALAQQLGVTNQAVSKWESDQCCPDVLLLPKLADIFGITLDALFGRAVPAKEEVNITQQDWPDDNVLRVVMYVGQRLVGYGPEKEGYEYHYHGAVNGVVSYASISCGDVAGNVEVSGNLTCGNVAGNVDAGCNVTCGDVEGSVDAGCIVECGEVGGDIDAAGPVTIRK